MWIDGREWKLVPVEPTDEMREAGWKTRHEGHPLAQTYRAMLAAAPTPPAQAAPGDEEIKQPTNVIDGKVYKQQWFTWNEVRALLSRYGQAPAASECARKTQAVIESERKL